MSPLPGWRRLKRRRFESEIDVAISPFAEATTVIVSTALDGEARRTPAQRRGCERAGSHDAQCRPSRAGAGARRIARPAQSRSGSTAGDRGTWSARTSSSGASVWCRRRHPTPGRSAAWAPDRSGRAADRAAEEPAGRSTAARLAGPGIDLRRAASRGSRGRGPGWSSDRAGRREASRSCAPAAGRLGPRSRRRPRSGRRSPGRWCRRGRAPRRRRAGSSPRPAAAPIRCQAKTRSPGSSSRRRRRA